MMEHKLDMNNIERTWRDAQGFFHALCSCGTHFTGPDIEDVTSKFVVHVRDEGR